MSLDLSESVSSSVKWVITLPIPTGSLPGANERLYEKNRAIAQGTGSVAIF